MNDYQRLISKINTIVREKVNEIVDCRIKHGELNTDYSKDLTKEDIKYFASSEIEQSDKSIKRIK